MEFHNLREWFELLSYAAAIVGIPMAIIIYYRDKKIERKIREKEVLFTSHSLYVDYLKMCFENPELDSYLGTTDNKNISKEEKKELIIFEILFTYLESTYLYYEDLSDEVKRKRWSGWVNYIKDFASNENFTKAWRQTEGQWDQDFMKFMNKLILENK